MIMAHDPTRSWPTGKGPGDTSIPGAAWLELLNGQAFPVVGAGAMVWNGTMWVPVSTQNRLPVDAEVSGTVDVSDRADRQLGKVELSGSSVPDAQPVPTKSVSRKVLVTQIGTTVTVGAGVNAVIYQDNFTDGVDSIALTAHETSNASHSWKVVVDYRVAPADDFSVSLIEATSNGPTAAVVRHQVRTARAYFRIHNQDTVSRTYNVFVTKWY